MSDLEREVVFNGAWDRRSDDPSENYGVHGVSIRFYVKGPEGVVQFIVYTHWHLPHVQDEMLEKRSGSRRDVELFFTPMAADIGYHSPEPLHGHEIETEDCDLLDGTCYYGGSGLRAKDYLETLIEGGTEKLWPEMEAEYRAVLEG